jgi:DNA-binding CsgD family transcriptional regulator
MPSDGPLHLEDDGVLELLRDYDALRMWEVLRSARSAVTIAELCRATGSEQQLVQRQLDLLVRHGLVESIRARKPRKSIGYRVATERILVTFDDDRPESVRRAMASSDAVRREFERCVERYSDPAFHPASGVRFRQHSIQHFTKEDFAELRRRMLAVIEFLGAPRPRPPQLRGSRADRIPPSAFCNQAVSIELDPIVGNLLPLPAVWMTPRSKLDRAEPAGADKSGLPSLAPREREVALALADGLSRAHVAERMQLSVHTVSTLARRIYRKLGVTSQAALAARLAGHVRRKLGER